QPGQHRLRRPPGREEPGPDVERGVGIAQLLERGDLGQRGHPLVTPAGQGAQLARLEVWQDPGRTRGEPPKIVCASGVVEMDRAGSKRLIPASGPTPGSTPTSVPTTQPTNA